MKRVRSQSYISLLIVASIAQAVAQQPHHNVITTEQVAGAIALEGVVIDTASIHLPMMLAATTSTPALSIFGVGSRTTQGVQIQLRCDASECLAFTALVDLSVQQEQMIRHLHPDGAAFKDLQVSQSASTSESLFSPGHRVVLWLQAGHVTMHLPAIALEAGSKGLHVRVCTPERTRTYEALVMDAGNVLGVTQ
jgi:hypothetical protein